MFTYFEVCVCNKEKEAMNLREGNRYPRELLERGNNSCLCFEIIIQSHNSPLPFPLSNPSYGGGEGRTGEMLACLVKNPDKHWVHEFQLCWSLPIFLTQLELMHPPSL